MLVRMIGSVSGHFISHDGENNAVVNKPPQRGDVIDVDDMTAALWIDQRMAVAHEEAAAVSGAADETAALTTKAVKR